jgi:hypothetical protein
MDFMGGLPMYRIVHDYLYVVLDIFKKMCMLMPMVRNMPKLTRKHNYSSVMLGFTLDSLLLLYHIKTLGSWGNFGHVCGER